MTHPAAPGFKPTMEQLHELWMNRMPYAPLEKFESDVGWYEWYDEFREAIYNDALNAAILALDEEFLTDNTGDPTDEGYNMALHDAQRAIEDLKGGA